MVRELSDEARTFLNRIIEQSITYKIEKVGEGGYQVIGIRAGRVVWKSRIVSSLQEANQIIIEMVDVGV